MVLRYCRRIKIELLLIQKYYQFLFFTAIWMLVFEVIKCAAKLKTLTVKNIFLSQWYNKRMYKDKKPKQTFNCESIYKSFFRISFILSQSRKRKCKKKWTTYTRHTSLEIIPNQVMPLINHDGRFRRRRIMYFNHIELKHVKKKWNCRKFFCTWIIIVGNW